MFLLLSISFLLTIFYVSIMWTYKNEWEETEETHSLSENPRTAVSVVIPARNEGRHIAQLLHDLTEQVYPVELTEIIVIDDFSEDDTYAEAARFAQAHTHIRVLRLQDLLPESMPTEAYKKKAIEAAVQRAKGELILTTDADCRLQKHWIHSVVSFYEKEKCALIAAPVGYYNEQTRFQHFQALDFCGMQAITAAMLRMEIFNMANGANLAYERKAFLAVNGYQGIDQKASGDDMLLVYKIAKQFPDKVRFLKNRAAIVLTEPMHTLHDFLQQRFRWTSKSASYQDWRVTAILGLVYLFVCTIWLNFILFIGHTAHLIFFADHTIIAIIRFLPVLLYLLMLIFQVACKSVIDHRFLGSASAFFNRHDLMKTFGSSELLHIWYIPYVGTLGNLLRYQWKGRKLK